MAFYEHEREFFRIYLNEKHGLDLNEKHGLEVAPKDPHKRLLRHMYLQGVDMLACVLRGHGRRVLRKMEPQRLAFFLQEMMSTVLGQRIQGKTRPLPSKRMPHNCSTCSSVVPNASKNARADTPERLPPWQWPVVISHAQARHRLTSPQLVLRSFSCRCSLALDRRDHWYIS